MKRMLGIGLISSLWVSFASLTLALPPNRFTRLQYDQLKMGMTYDEVTKLLGEDGLKDEGFQNNTEPNSSVTYHWINPDGSAISVRFNADEKIINLASYNLSNPSHLQMNRTQEGTLQDLSQSQITIDAYNQLKMGMTYDEVVALVGSAGQKDSEINGQSINLSENRYHWLNSNGSRITVIFDEQQKVKSILTQNLDRYAIGNIPSQNQSDQPILATREHYYKLRLGMTYEDVKVVMGTNGTFNANFNPESAEDFKGTYEWMNPDGTGIKVIFNSQDQVLSIYSYGLGVGLRTQ